MAGCLNGGSCLFDEGKDTFACSCNPQWRGETCHMGKVLVLTYTFLENSETSETFIEQNYTGQKKKSSSMVRK